MKVCAGFTGIVLGQAKHCFVERVVSLLAQRGIACQNCSDVYSAMSIIASGLEHAKFVVIGPLWLMAAENMRFLNHPFKKKKVRFCCVLENAGDYLLIKATEALKAGVFLATSHEQIEMFLNEFADQKTHDAIAENKASRGDFRQRMEFLADKFFSSVPLLENIIGPYTTGIFLSANFFAIK